MRLFLVSIARLLWKATRLFSTAIITYAALAPFMALLGVGCKWRISTGSSSSPAPELLDVRASSHSGDLLPWRHLIGTRK